MDWGFYIYRQVSQAITFLHGELRMTQAWDFVDANMLWQRHRDPLLNRSLLELELSVRTINALYHCRRRLTLGRDSLEPNPIKTVRELLEFSENELLREPNFGRKSLQEVKEVLGYHGLTLRDSKVPQVRTMYCPTDRFPLTKQAESEPSR